MDKCNTVRAGAHRIKLLDVLSEVTKRGRLNLHNMHRALSTMLQVKYVCVNKRKERELSRCRLFGSFPWSCWGLVGGAAV